MSHIPNPYGLKIAVTVINLQYINKIFYECHDDNYAYPLSPPNTYKASFHATRVCLLRLVKKEAWVVNIILKVYRQSVHVYTCITTVISEQN